MSLLRAEDRERLYKELDYLQKEIHYHGSSIWVVNSILITGSLLVAFSMKSDIFFTPIASLILILASLILTTTTNVINRKWQERLERIREELGILEPNKKFISFRGKWWYRLRVNSVYFLYTSLASIYVHLIFPKCFLSLVVFLSGIAAIITREALAYERK